jgi:hypothetical protein
VQRRAGASAPAWMALVDASEELLRGITPSPSCNPAVR